MLETTYISYCIDNSYDSEHPWCSIRTVAETADRMGLRERIVPA